MSIKNTIRKKRDDHNFTQEYVAEILGISTKWYGKIENNKAQPTIEMAVKLMDLYKCELTDIIDFSNGTTFNNINQQGTYIAQNFGEREKIDEQLKLQYELRLKEKEIQNQQLMEQYEARLSEKNAEIAFVKKLLERG